MRIQKFFRARVTGGRVLFLDTIRVFFRFSKREGEAPRPSSPNCTSVSDVGEYASISLNMPKYPWKCLNKLFWLCCKYAWLSYMFDRLLKMPWVQNNEGLWTWHSCSCLFRKCQIMAPYASVMPEYALIFHNMPEHG